MRLTIEQRGQRAVYRAAAENGLGRLCVVPRHHPGYNGGIVRHPVWR